MSDNQFIRHEPCPVCRSRGDDNSGDNKGVWQDGTGYCFCCKQYFEQELTANNVPNTLNTDEQFLFGNYIDIPDRALLSKTCEFYRYQVLNDREGTRHIANYYNSLGKRVKQKIRVCKTKRFYNIGDKKFMSLCGMNLWKPSKNIYVTITEGEIDMLSAAQVKSDIGKFPVVSLSDGSSSVRKCIAANIDWLLGWKHVVLAFDADKAGRDAVESAVDELSATQVFVVNWPEGINDANELLKAGRSAELRKCLLDATPIIPESIINLGLISSRSLIPAEMGHSWGWQGLDRPTYGIRLGELILIGGGSSVGKTTFLNQIALKLIFDVGVKVGIISFEQSPEQVTQRLIGNMINQRIWLPGAKYDIELAKSAGDRLINKAYAIDTSKGIDSVKKVVDKIIYFTKVIGIRYIFLDHITSVASMIVSDERRGLDSVMMSFAKIIKDLGCTLFVVSHLSKPNMYDSNDPNTSKTFEQGRKVTGADFRGSQSLQYYPTMILGIYRNISEINSPLIVELLKNRIDGDKVGSKVELAFNRDTGKLQEIDEII